MKLNIKEWDIYWRLIIIKEIYWKKRRHFECECECWKNKIILLESLRNWKTKSCGCLQKELASWIQTHWMKWTRIYRIWRWMKTRCYNKNSSAYKYYGARGIVICNKWLNSFEEFRNDMYDSYLKHFKENNWDTTIDRVNVNWNYNKENCSWQTIKEQNNNKQIHYERINKRTIIN